MSPKEQPKRLGRGLAALLGDSAVPVSVAAPGVQSLGVEVLEASPFQPRRDMNEEALDELADSIRERGILQPLLVRPHPSKPGNYQIIAGERRWRAAQKAQLHEVPVLVRALSDSDAMAAGLVENLQRRDLNLIEEAMGYQRLIEEFRMTHEKLAEAIGKSRAHIGSCLRLLNLPEPVRDMVRNGALSFGHVRAILAHPVPEQAARQVVEGDLTVRQTEALTKAYQASLSAKLRTLPRGKQPPRSEPDAETEALARQLSERLGTKVTVTFTGTGGTVVINYKNLDQLDEVLMLLNG